MKLYSCEIASLTQEFFYKKKPLSQKLFIWIITFLLISILIICCFAKFEEVIKVSGLIRPKDNISSVSNAVTGRIDSVLYTNGQNVDKGQILLQIDKTQYLMQKESLLAQMEDEEKKLQNLYQIQESINSNKNLISPSNTEAYFRYEIWHANLYKLDNICKLNQELFLQESYLPETMTTSSRLKELESKYKISIEEYNDYDYSFRYNIAQEITQLETSNQINNSKLKQIDDSILYTTVTAPIDGIIQEISAFNNGDWIQEGQSLFNIIPKDVENTKIELTVSAKQAGKLCNDMNVKMRFPSLPYHEFGGAEGKILTIDADMKPSKDGEAFFLVICDINKQSLFDKKGKEYPLKVGLQVDARIILEKKTIIQFVLEKMNLWY